MAYIFVTPNGPQRAYFPPDRAYSLIGHSSGCLPRGMPYMRVDCIGFGRVLECVSVSIGDQRGEPEPGYSDSRREYGVCTASEFSSTSSLADWAAPASSSPVVGPSVAWMKAPRRAKRGLV